MKDEVKETLEYLAEALKIPAEMVYGILVKQIYISTFCDFLWVLFFSYITYDFYKYFKSIKKDGSYDPDYDLRKGITAALIIVMGFALVLLLSTVIPNVLSALFNIDYLVITEASNILKGVSK
jgi:hypothetical protein